MSLKGFHVLFITISTLLAALCALLCLQAFRHEGGGAALAGAVASLAGGVALSSYGVWFYRKMGRLQ